MADMELGRTPYWLTLMGPTGTGKTMLMKQVFDQARRINPGNPINNPIWPPDWERALLKTYEGGRPYCIWLEEARFAKRLREGEYDLPENLRTDFLVAYDELGGARDPSNFISEALARLAQTRLRHWMLFTSNLTLQEIGDRIDPRVSSRLIRDDNVLVQFRARDYAMRKLERVA